MTLLSRFDEKLRDLYTLKDEKKKLQSKGVDLQFYELRSKSRGIFLLSHDGEGTIFPAFSTHISECAHQCQERVKFNLNREVRPHKK